MWHRLFRITLFEHNLLTMTHGPLLHSHHLGSVFLFPTLVSDNCKQTKLLFEMYDAGPRNKAIWVTQMYGVCVYVTAEMFCTRFLGK